MNCHEVQKRYIRFIDDKLSVKELDAFLKHMSTCTDCFEEYDIYYTMIMGTRYLEKDTYKGTDWVDAKEKLKYAKEYLVHHRIRRFEKIIILFLLCLGSMFLY